ncbi:hypothetical protein VTJ04DRAFT_4570 [Mycothermus thermophilus]|uniref:uncharacterized protein n=1 Tax=Humicola insolens TaxID=85995 RepID=UPI003742E392
MCGDHPPPTTSPPSGWGSEDPFPWHLGLPDAHCHPTDTMSSIPSIASMRASVLTIMATRSQDQDLVASVGSSSNLGVRSRTALSAHSDAERGEKERVIPAFGWHPWFSYQLFDDTTAAVASGDDGDVNQGLKALHYKAVLTPEPSDEFVAALPDPIPLSKFIADTKRRVSTADVGMIGEIGLDKAFRLPWPWGMTGPSSTTATEAAPAEEEQRSSSPSSGITPGGRENRALSPHHVRMPHQIAVLSAQLRLAGELGVPVSVHGVQAHGVLYDVFKGLWKGYEKEVVSRRKQKLVAPGAEDFSSSSEDEDEYEEDDFGWEEGEEGAFKPAEQKPKPPAKPAGSKKPYKPTPFPPRICLHSFSGSPQTLKQYTHPTVPAKVYFSFSTAINLSTAGGAAKFGDVVRACPDDRVLVESDLHVAGPDMDAALEEITRKVCEVKGWTLEDGVERIRKNYEEFVFG